MAYVLFHRLAFVVLLSAPSALVAQVAPELAGTWQGTWETPRPQRIVLKIARAGGGAGVWQAVFFSIDSDMASHGRGATSVVLQGLDFKFTIAPIEGSYQGKLSPDGAAIAGAWTQGNQSHPLNLTRATTDTAWTIPTPPQLMPSTADPAFEVATIKPGEPNNHSSGIHSVGHHPMIENKKIGDLLAFSYGIHPKQIVDAPGWFWTDRYDIDGVLDMDGQPNLKQVQAIIRKVLADRLHLTLRREQRELSVYALTIAKGGSKLVKSDGDPNGIPDTTGSSNATGHMVRFTNASAADLTLELEFDLDRPVVDQTGLAGRFDCLLKWREDDAPDDPNAAPGIFRAVQEQLGLKLEPVKAPADVFVVEHVERPSSN